ncbi:MAG TPA: WG repeat-containing protein [Pyrinomonadaceae bacterium]|nr:WG repeat-containing protein [Pyrinomonadaceae bacterium]
MQYVQRSILLLICLTVLFGCNSARMQEKQSKETRLEETSQPSNLFVVMDNKKYGFIDRTGKIVIKPQFESATDFVEGRAIVGIRNDEFKLSYIDEAGRLIAFPQFDNVQNFSEGLAAVGVGEFTMHGGGNHKWGFVDKTGKLVIELNFREIRDFSEGLAAVMNEDGKWGYIDKTGKVVIPFQFEDAFSFSEDLACVLTDGLFGFIDKSGKVVIEPRFSIPSQFKEGLASVKIGDKNNKVLKYYNQYYALEGELMFIDKTGNTAIKFDGDVVKINDFSEGLAAIVVKEKEDDFYTGFIDKTGKLVIKLPFYGLIGNFSEGLAIVEHKDKYGFINKRGKIVVKLKYPDAEGFRNGLAKISIGKQLRDFEGTENLGYNPKSGYIDKTGKVIWQPTK